MIEAEFEAVAAVAERLTAKEQSGVARLEVARLFLKTNQSPPRAPNSGVK